MRNKPQAKFGLKVDSRLSELLTFFKKSGNAFVPAAGYGGTVRALLDADWQVFAVDNDPEVIKELKKLAKHGQLTVRSANVSRLDLGNNKFDLVIVSNFLHFFDKETGRNTLINCKKSLKTGGILFVRLFTKDDPLSAKMPGNFYPTLDEIKRIFGALEVLDIREILVKDNHPPYGPHTHSVLEMIVKNSKPLKDRSYGVIPYCVRDGKILFLLVKHAIGHWGFPKGHPEKGETPQQTVKRELLEEAGISSVKIKDRIKLTEKYSFKKEGETYNKVVAYFLGQVPALVEAFPPDENPEVVDLALVDYKKARQLLTYPEPKSLLDRALKVISKSQPPQRVPT